MRFQLATLNDARDDSRSQDSWGVNCFVEKEEELRAVKRPGLIGTIDVVGSGTIGQGLFIWPDYTGLNPQVVWIWDDVLWLHEIDPALEALIWNNDPDNPSTVEGTITTTLGWDFGDSSLPEGVVATAPYPVTFPLEPAPVGPVAGWEMLAGSLPLTPVDGNLPLSLLGGNLVQLDTGIYGQDIFSSSDGTSWDAGVGWPGPAYENAYLGWYDGTYIWSVTSSNPMGFFLRLSYASQTVIGFNSLPAYWGAYAVLQTFVVGGNIYITKNHGFSSYVYFAKSPVGSIVWTGYESDLLKADVGSNLLGYTIVVLGSTFYALPPGGAGGKKVYSSSDFDTWTLLTSDWGLGASLIKQVSREAYTGKIVVLLDDDNVASTSDGITWTKSNFIPVITGTFTPYSLCKFGSYWYTAGGSNWARLLNSRVP